MLVECPRCHGMMDHDVCEYCGCFDPTFRARVTPEAVVTQESASATQPNVVVNNYITQPIIEREYNFAPLSADRQANRISQKKKWLAFFLCFFGGMFGVHRFYVGKTKMGFLYLCTAGLVGYGWLFDLVWIAIGKFKDAHGYPLKR